MKEKIVSTVLLTALVMASGLAAGCAVHFDRGYERGRSYYRAPIFHHSPRYHQPRWHHHNPYKRGHFRSSNDAAAIIVAVENKSKTRT